MFYYKYPCVEASLFVRLQLRRWGLISNTILPPGAMVRSHYRRGWGLCTAVIGNCIWQKSMYLAWFCLSVVNSSIGGRFQTQHWAPVSMVWSPHRRDWGPCSAIISNGLWQKSMYWAWFYLSDVNSSIGGRFQTPHWAPVTIEWSPHRRGWGPCTTPIVNGLWQRSMYWCYFCLPDVNSSVGGRFQTPHWAPVAMVGSHHRRGWGPGTAIIGNGLWQKSMYWAWFSLSDVNSSVRGRFQAPHWTPVAMVRSHHRRGWGPCTVPIVNGLWQKPMYWG